MTNDIILKTNFLDPLIKERKTQIAHFLEDDPNLEKVIEKHDQLMHGFKVEHDIRMHLNMKGQCSAERLNQIHHAKENSSRTLLELAGCQHDLSSNYMLQVIDTLINYYGVVPSSTNFNENVNYAINVLLVSLECDDSLSYLDKGLSIVKKFSHRKGQFGHRKAQYDSDLLQSITKTNVFLSDKGDCKSKEVVKKLIVHFDDESKEDKFEFTFKLLNKIKANPISFSDVIDFIENHDKEYLNENFTRSKATLNDYFNQAPYLIDNKELRTNLNIHEIDNLDFCLRLPRTIPEPTLKEIFQTNLLYSLNDLTSEKNSLQENKVRLNDWVMKVYDIAFLMRGFKIQSYNHLTSSLIKEVDLFSNLSSKEYGKLLEFNSFCESYVLKGEGKNLLFQNTEYNLSNVYSGILNQIKEESNDVLEQKQMLLEMASNSIKLIKEGKYDEFRLAVGGSV